MKYKLIVKLNGKQKWVKEFDSPISAEKERDRISQENGYTVEIKPIQAKIKRLPVTKISRW